MKYRLSFHALLGGMPLGHNGLTGHLSVEISGDTLSISGAVVSKRSPIRFIRVVGGSQLVEIPADPENFDLGRAAVKFMVRVGLAQARTSEFEFAIWTGHLSGGMQKIGTVFVSTEFAGDAPFFVVGSPRSGTSILGYSLQRVLGIHGYGECHVAPILLKLNETIGQYYLEPNNAAAATFLGVMLSEITPREWMERQARVLASVYRSNHPDAVFVDKTPGWPMIRALPAVMLAWPNAKIVFAKRRGIENVQSRARKFPSLPFVQHCMDWAAAMNEWVIAKKEIPSSQIIEVDQRDLETRPGREAARLAAFVGHPIEERLREAFATLNPERTAKPTAESPGMDDTGWSEEDKATFIRNCGDIMAVYGYSTDSRYYLG